MTIGSAALMMFDSDHDGVCNCAWLCACAAGERACVRTVTIWDADRRPAQPGVAEVQCSQWPQA